MKLEKRIKELESKTALNELQYSKNDLFNAGKLVAEMGKELSIINKELQIKVIGLENSLKICRELCDLLREENAKLKLEVKN